MFELVVLIACVGGMVGAGLVSHDAHRRHRVWHVIERPEPQMGKDAYGSEKVVGYTGRLQVCVDRRVALHVIKVGVCEFDDYETLTSLRVKAQERAVHLNRARNEA